MRIILAPTYLHRNILLNLRKKDPFLDVKLVSKSDLEKYCYNKPNNDALIYLMTEHKYNYEIAKMFLEFVPYIESDFTNYKLHFLYGLKNDLEAHGYLLKIDDKHNLIAHQKVEVMGYLESDIEIQKLAKKLDLTLEFKKNEKGTKILTYQTYDLLEDEVYSVLNKIASLLDDGVSIKDFYIFKRNNTYDYYLKKFSSSFGFEINLDNSESYTSTGAFKEFIKIYEKNRDIKESLTSLKKLMKDDDFVEEFASVVKQYHIRDINFETQKDFLYSSLANKKVQINRFDNAVEVIKNPIVGENKHIFVIGFAQGLYPRSYKDDKYLNNEELHLINKNNAKDNTKIDEDSLIDFFNSNNHFYFSFSSSDLSSNYYLSPLAKIMELRNEKAEMDDVFYSNKALTYIYTNLKDKELFYKERTEDYFKIRDVIEIDYNSYDNSYKYKPDAFNEYSKLTFSTTQLEQFSNCPFHYYLSRVISLEDDETTFNMNLGNIAHSVFENFRKNSFVFDDFFDKSLAKYSFTPSEKFFMTHKLKDQILTATKAIKEREKRYRNPTIYNEITLNAALDAKTTIIGKIDNCVVLDDQYVICIDYKTGSSGKFVENKLEYGLSSQLPTYTLLCGASDKFADYLVAGIYINHVLSNSLTDDKKEDDLISPYLKLQGKTINDIDIISFIDPTIADGSCSFIHSVKLSKKTGDFDSRSNVVSEEKFEEYKNIVTEKYLEMADKIRNNEFDISPLYLSTSDYACRYCPFKDICYVKVSQYRAVKKEEEEDE